jgi:plasmid maintenance system antidote protein VapI
MNCIDAIEGTVKRIIDQTYENLALDRMDDTEYIRNIKVAIEAVDSFINENREVTTHPEVIKKVLYDYAKEKWMVYRSKCKDTNKATINENDDLMDSEYFYYYYDYIYDRGVQPY